MQQCLYFLPFEMTFNGQTHTDTLNLLRITCMKYWGCIRVGSPPDIPMNVTVASVGRNFLVQWLPPLHIYGQLRHFRLVYVMLPHMNHTLVVDNQTTFAIIRKFQRLHFIKLFFGIISTCTDMVK